MTEEAPGTMTHEFFTVEEGKSRALNLSKIHPIEWRPALQSKWGYTSYEQEDVGFGLVVLVYPTTDLPIVDGAPFWPNEFEVKWRHFSLVAPETEFLALRRSNVNSFVIPIHSTLMLDRNEYIEVKSRAIYGDKFTSEWGHATIHNHQMQEFLVR